VNPATRQVLCAVLVVAGVIALGCACAVAFAIGTDPAAADAVPLMFGGGMLMALAGALIWPIERSQ
jgi:hypothetical protein